ncbi:unnamed protein product [Acanthoscelides obtectus]|uniref:Uncharacterized protein n=1 Tax=Acanthoscelides obtectus TaxID=200917 RepID=A0A9P0LH90_ACAOB|nr:unnamed protein product [Acanthoscelides obtectus]CAK1632863.1 hypothetical protein AOBTE_LOCUS7777 [Acanthoscelides obtectus]
MVSTHCVIHRQALASQNIATEITPGVGLGYKDCIYFARISILITKSFGSIQKYAGCPKATCWLAFMN